MSNDEDFALVIDALAEDGIIFEKIAGEDELYVTIVLDPQNTDRAFDKLDELEIELIKAAGNNIQTINSMSSFIDDIRDVLREKISEYSAHEKTLVSSTNLNKNKMLS